MLVCWRLYGPPWLFFCIGNEQTVQRVGYHDQTESGSSAGLLQVYDQVNAQVSGRQVYSKWHYLTIITAQSVATIMRDFNSRCLPRPESIHSDILASLANIFAFVQLIFLNCHLNYEDAKCVRPDCGCAFARKWTQASQKVRSVNLLSLILKVMKRTIRFAVAKQLCAKFWMLMEDPRLLPMGRTYWSATKFCFYNISKRPGTQAPLPLQSTCGRRQNCCKHGGDRRATKVYRGHAGCRSMDANLRSLQALCPVRCSSK